MSVVFRASRKKLLFFVILWGLFVLLCAQFPYVSDDWVWGMDSRLSAFFDSFSNTDALWHFYNTGRYLGNGFGFVAANHLVFRNVMMGTTLTLIVALIGLMAAVFNKKDERSFLCACLLATLLILSSPKERFRQSIAWCSAFMIYIVGACFSLASLFLLFRMVQGRTVPLWICGALPFLSAFFVENLSLGNVLFFLMALLYFRLNHKSVPGGFWIWGIGTVAGAALMLSDDGYRTVFNVHGDAVYWSASVHSLSEMLLSSLRCLRDDMPGYLLGSAGIWSVGMACAQIALERKDGFWGYAGSINLGIGVYFLLWRGFRPQIGMGWLRWVDFGFMVLYFLLCLWTFWRHGKISGNWIPLLILVYLAATTAPLLVAKPLSERVFFPAFVVEILLLDVCLLENFSYDCFLPLAVVFFVVYAYWLGIYGAVHRVDAARVAYARRRLAEGELVTRIPKLPYEDYLVVSYPYAEWMERYVRFYGLEGKMDISVCELDEWLTLPDVMNGWSSR